MVPDETRLVAARKPWVTLEAAEIGPEVYLALGLIGTNQRGEWRASRAHLKRQGDYRLLTYFSFSFIELSR